MPPVNQGSRAGLITATVISCIGFVVATVFAIYYYVDSHKATKDLETEQKRYLEIIPAVELTDQKVSSVKEARTTDPNLNAQMSVIDALIAQRNNLAKLIGTDEAKAAASVKTTLANAAAKVKDSGASLPENTPLTGAVDTLATAVAARQTEANNLKAQLKQAQDTLTNKTKETELALAAKDKQIEAIRAEQATAVSSVTTVSGDKDQQIAAVQVEKEQLAKQSQDAAAQTQVQVAELNRQLTQLTRERDAFKNQLESYRPDVNQALLKQVDARVVRLPGNSVAYIDLGSGEHLIAGMTFEVYDKIEGIPNVGARELNQEATLPAGKASLEVTRVGATSSECRIVRTTPGTTITEGDLVANLVYDRNIAYKFFVYGNYALGRGEKPTADEMKRDAETMKRLISQWGGQLMEGVNVDTDFVLLGREPEIPPFTKQDLEDVINKAKYDAAVADAKAYDDIRQRAIDLRIPILNQNRFLYLIGYYAQAQR